VFGGGFGGATTPQAVGSAGFAAFGGGSSTGFGGAGFGGGSTGFSGGQAQPPAPLPQQLQQQGSMWQMRG